MFGFSEEEIRRYSRHIILPEVGGRGQKKLRESRVLVVGAGGLGSPAAMYLAAAGIGTLGLVDPDRVELSNLQRQLLHTTVDTGELKVESARRRLAALNSQLCLELHPVRLGAGNVASLISGYDVVVDGVDNFPARYLLNDACVLAGKPLVEGGLLRFHGMAMTIVPGSGPCYRCVFPEPPPPGAVPSCSQAGVIGAAAGIIGTVQATEAIKVLLGIGRPLVGRVLTVDVLEGTYRTVEWGRNPRCPVCGERPTITSARELVEYDLVCDLPGAGTHAP